MVDHLKARQRLLSLGGLRLADYALELEQRIKELESPVAAQPDQCPYPLHPGHYGPNHARYVAQIPAEPWPLSVVKCEACGNITIEEPIAMA